MNNLEAYDRVVTAEIDLQNDFFPGGVLGLTGAETTLAPLNDVAEWTRQQGGQVVFTADKHPAQTKHFKDLGGVWAPHCVEGTHGAAFQKDIIIQPKDIILFKGTGTEDDGYSGFEGQAEDGTTLEEIVVPTAHERVALLVGGWALDYCLKATTLDGCTLADRINHGASPHRLDIYVVSDTTKAVNLQPNDGANAIDEMKLRGAHFITSREIVVDGKIAVRP